MHVLKREMIIVEGYTKAERQYCNEKDPSEYDVKDRIQESFQYHLHSRKISKWKVKSRYTQKQLNIRNKGCRLHKESNHRETEEESLISNNSRGKELEPNLPPVIKSCNQKNEHQHNITVTERYP